MNVRLGGVQFLSFPKFDKRFRKLVFQLEGEPKIVVQRGILRRAFEGCLELVNGSIEICFLKIGSAQVRAIAGVVGTQSQGGFKLRNRLGRLASLH